MTRTLVSIATYNEIENIPSLLAEIFSCAPAVDVLVIDDNSPDGTGRWLADRAQADARLRVLHRPAKLGLGTATLAGMQFAIAQGYDLVVNMDADFSHHPRYLPQLIDGMTSRDSGDVDVVIGSRYVPGGIRRHFMSRGVNLYARLLLGLSTRDCSGAFRCYRVARLAQVDLGSMVSVGYSFFEEILWRLKRLGCRFAETPIHFADRVQGASKINRQEAWNAVRIIFRLGFQGWRERWHLAPAPRL